MTEIYQTLSKGDKAALQSKLLAEGKISVSQHKQSTKKDSVFSEPTARIEETISVPAISVPAPSPAKFNVKDFSREEDLEKFLLPQENYFPLQFADAAEMLVYFRKDILEGSVSLYPWQIETLIFASDSSKFTKEFPLRYQLCATNGSGKDAYVISPLAVYLCLCRIRSRVIITSSSYNQLHTQTESYISSLCETINSRLAAEGVCEKAFIVKKEHIVCTLTGSEIKLFVTDDAGRAEGDHPFPDYPNSEMCIIINEAKTVPEDIFRSLRKCTGFNRWIEVSSPGGAQGHFFTNFTNSVHYPAAYDKTKRYSRRVTAFDCAHFTEAEIEEARAEWDEDLFRQTYLAEFSSIGDKVCVSLSKLNEMLKNPPDVEQKEDRAAGLDLSLGGDETVIAFRIGNKIEKLEILKFKDAVLLAERLDNIFKEHELSGVSIYVDVGGLGRPIYHMLLAKGWKLIPIDNQARAINHKLYLNRVTEDWLKFGNYVSRNKIILPNDNKLFSQLTSRRYKQPNNEKLRLESKPEMASRGLASPDRADAVILAFCNFTPNVIKNERQDIVSKQGATVSKSRISQSDLITLMSENKFKSFAGNSQLRGSLSRALQHSIIHNKV